ncbi:Flavodoxin reductase (ferredoxin-NADPH reductase) family 1 [Pseudonocardia sp. Ae168_Ps1]|nr:Flavodoxin reductase (ferredoxin-NADPH reductase) family 1 [Pseudonocardia sp. Ae150A_Ps1]OLL80658.1 Flavodoxin reductase (ferredoxin-NADPH reductase) family 1 [Pseudonocardia sp. Ae168_Ps1]OLL85213.1 Flavodoxin reductase (ferredoxin-NADPH reductase) family 1 [Pseudonocardia sp. Ae263_Ps1]OLL94762.1 Flavodoxin reductase (ferredoxin-NADPH reductase) family 1 [Pseudonocardia sp. Ae356_Ps1]
MVRFRPNLVVSGAPAWAEDGWRRVRIGDARFRVVKGCARCVLTTVDPVTAVKGREPMVTLARHRRFDKGVWFGMNLVPDDPGTELHVGDPVEVLDAADPADGPPR